MSARDDLPIMAFASRAPWEQWLGEQRATSKGLMSLLTNVQRYAYPSGTGGPVEIGARGDHDRFVVAVRDRGVGIPADQLAHVFDAFFTTGRTVAGSGLGMAIVHNVVTSGLHGTVSIDSTVGEGTTVTVAVPRSVPELDPGAQA